MARWYSSAQGTLGAILLVALGVAAVLPVGLESKFTLFFVVAGVAIAVFVFTLVRERKRKDDEVAEIFMREAVPPPKPEDPKIGVDPEIGDRH